MKIIKKPTEAIVECSLCGCEYTIQGKDWRLIERNKTVSSYYAKCPNCFHYKTIIPGDIKCKK